MALCISENENRACDMVKFVFFLLIQVCFLEFVLEVSDTDLINSIGRLDGRVEWCNSGWVGNDWFFFFLFFSFLSIFCWVVALIMKIYINYCKWFGDCIIWLFLVLDWVWFCMMETRNVLCYGESLVFFFFFCKIKLRRVC